MASLPNSKTVTYEEWLRMPEVKDFIEEVVNGEVRIMPPPQFKHALIVRRICRALDTLSDGILTLKQYPHVQIDIGSIWPE